jgi:hypothetical protein
MKRSRVKKPLESLDISMLKLAKLVSDGALICLPCEEYNGPKCVNISWLDTPRKPAYEMT